MVVLSARFAVLACLCAALPLVAPPPVEAAHLYGSQSMKHASSSHSQHRTRSAYPTPTHDSKHEHKAPHNRGPEPPSLLRRYSVHDHTMADDHQGKDSHKLPHRARSVFARSRYRQESRTHSRRSSVYVPGEHGNTYLVSRTPPRSWGNARADEQSNHAHNRRQVDESNLVLGRIDIMGAAQPAGGTQRLASLTVESTPIDWRSGESSLKAFPLNASTANQTQFIMMPMDEVSNVADAGSINKHVTLATEVFDAGSAEMVMYCATYDPDPGSSSALLMTPCTGETQSAPSANDAANPCSDTGSDASSSDPHQSQIFSYDPSSGKIEPISVAASSPSVGNSSDNLVGCAGAKFRRADSNSTTSASTQPTSTTTSIVPTASVSQQAQNVTLIYVAGALEVPASSPGASNTTSTAQSIGQAAVFTTTITTTVVATATVTGSSNRAVTPPQAAVSVTAPSLSITASRSSSSSGLPSSVPATTTSKGPASAEKSLEVEIVGVTLSTTPSSSSTSSTTTTTTASTTTSSLVNSSLNAEAVASSVANGMVQPRRRIFVSAAGAATPSSAV